MMKLCKKQKFLASRLQRPGMTSSLKKLLANCCKTVADDPKTALLAARAISNSDTPAPVHQGFQFGIFQARFWNSGFFWKS